LDAVIACEDRRGRLDAVIDQTAHHGPWAGTVARLECVRGIATLTAFGLAAQVGNWQRFTGATIGAYLGLTPRRTPAAPAAPRGRSPRPATPTPDGCWSRPPGTTASRCPAGRAGPPGPDARPSRPPRARARAADERLHRRWIQLEARKKPPTIAAVAIARELAGWCWSLAVMTAE
jgi:transposase